MVLELKLRKVGNSVGLVLPKKLLTHLKVGAGDTLSVTETQDGIRVTSKNPQFAKSMAIFDDLSKRYRNTLRELAK
jgi:putative addiction module antidote